MLFRHWSPLHDTSLAGCNSDIVTVEYSFCALSSSSNDSFLIDLRF